MRWHDLESDTEAGLWKGLDLRLEMEPTGPVRPGLHMQAGSPQLIRLMAGAGPILWARVESDFHGYWYLRRPLVDHSPGLVLPPISALEARSVETPAGSPEWFRSWSSRRECDFYTECFSEQRDFRSICSAGGLCGDTQNMGDACTGPGGLPGTCGPKPAKGRRR